MSCGSFDRGRERGLNPNQQADDERHAQEAAALKRGMQGQGHEQRSQKQAR